MRTLGNPPPENYGCHCRSCKDLWRQRCDFIVRASVWIAQNRPDIADPVAAANAYACAVDQSCEPFDPINPAELLWASPDQIDRMTGHWGRA